MNSITIKELCRALRITVFNVQRYEKDGIIIPEGVDSDGYQLYKGDSVARIKKARKYEEMGYSLEETKQMLQLSDREVKEKLNYQYNRLKEQYKSIEQAMMLTRELMFELKD